MTTYRISEAARLLGVSDDTVRRWMEDGTLTRRGKFFAVSGLAFGLSMTILALHERPLLLAVAGLPQLAAAFYLATRPESEG